MKTALVDTSFLITLANPAQRQHHKTAVQYFRTCIDRGVVLHLSTIVIAEFSQKQPIRDLQLRNFVVLPFNIDHAIEAGRLHGLLAGDKGDERAAVKDDIKLIAQCRCLGIDAVFTEDRKTLAKYADRLRRAKESAPNVVVLADGFDAAWFNDGQAALPYE
jgi:predicted nucleic acid-binding protein